MYLLFEDAGKFLAGRILSETDASSQVEVASGKRHKVKATHALLRFEQPEPAQLLTQATTTAEEIDLDLAWECAGEEEFGFADLAADYFGAKPSTVQLAAALFRLFEAPHYFRRAGKGRFKKASQEVLQQALAGIAKRQAIQAEIDRWTEALCAQQCPEPIKAQLYKILFKPDKNAPEYKAVVAASKQTQTGALNLLAAAGAISSPFEFHWQRFLFDQFPKGIAFPALNTPAVDAAKLPLADVKAFSIDDSSTTEIDDALSVQGLDTPVITLGIHIAAPGLAIQPDDPIDQLARTRMSTVYMPGYKITMLPDSVVNQYTLAAGQDCPALSLYVDFDANDLSVLNTVTKLERVTIAENLRHDQLSDVFNDAYFDDPAPNSQPNWGSELRWLNRLAKHLKAQREVVRGKPENFNRPDYTFKLDKPGSPDDFPAGDEIVRIGVRPRGSALDLIVAEAMIVANSTWGQWLGQMGVPGIYRSQASLAPGNKVRMGTKVAPHAGIGVPAYAWSTSPLRRYADLVNQWQLIACVNNGPTAALVAPFKPKDAQLFAIISGFEANYSAYNQFQNAMERYWTLQYVLQNQVTEVTATLIKDDLVRADELPLVLNVVGASGLPRGAHVRVTLSAPDLMALDIVGTVVERLDVDDSGSDTFEDA
ncbi:MAG: ribonuclease catalytic domain-containing protein, partial [Burkholderiaceae bacterium]